MQAHVYFLQGKCLLVWPVSGGCSEGRIAFLTGQPELAAGRLVVPCKSSLALDRCTGGDMRPDLSVPGRMLFVLPRAASSLSSLPVPPTGSSRCCVWPSPLTTPFSGKGVETPLFQALLPTPFQSITFIHKADSHVSCLGIG